MCKNWIEIENGKLRAVSGIFKKGKFIICLECENIMKYNHDYKNELNIAKVKVIGRKKKGNKE